MDENNFDDAKVRLPDGRIAFDCLKLAEIPTAGIFLRDYPNHVVFVRTRNTLYTLVVRDGQVTAHAERHDGSRPTFVPEPTPINVHGSTWGGSLLKLDYIGVNMHLEFDYDKQCITTTAIENVRVALLSEAAAASEIQP